MFCNVPVWHQCCQWKLTKGYKDLGTEDLWDVSRKDPWKPNEGKNCILEELCSSFVMLASIHSENVKLSQGVSKVLYMEIKSKKCQYVSEVLLRGMKVTWQLCFLISRKLLALWIKQYKQAQDWGCIKKALETEPQMSPVRSRFLS